MSMRKRSYLIACVLLCALFLAGLPFSAFADEAAPMAELHLEKNGHPLDLTLQSLSLDGGNLLMTIGIDKITGWKDEEPPTLIVTYKEPYQEFRTSLFTAETVKSLPESAKNYKTTVKFPYSGAALPDQILIDVGEKTPLPFWPESKPESTAEPASTPKPASAPKPTSTPKPTADPSQAALKNIRSLLDQKKYYAAVQALDKCYENYPQAEGECDALLDKLLEAVAAKRPQTGELERTLQYQGRNELRIHAESGDVHITGRDKKTGQYVSYYIREGDSAVIYFPGGTYDLEVEVGNYWFDNVNGFGEYCDSDSTELDFKYKDDGTWTSYTWYEFTI